LARVGSGAAPRYPKQMRKAGARCAARKSFSAPPLAADLAPLPSSALRVDTKRPLNRSRARSEFNGSAENAQASQGGRLLSALPHFAAVLTRLWGKRAETIRAVAVPEAVAGFYLKHVRGPTTNLEAVANWRCAGRSIGSAVLLRRGARAGVSLSADTPAPRRHAPPVELLIRLSTPLA